VVRARGLRALLFVLALAPGPAHAQSSVDEATRTRARQLGEQGLDLYDQGDFGGALARLDEADALVQAPTLGLFAARCLVKLGRWTEASERYAAVMRMTLPPHASNVLKAALVDAEKERAALLATIPRLEVALEGPAAPGARVELDGAPLDPSAMGQKRPIDPGIHRVLATRGEVTASEEVRLAPSDVRRVVLRLGDRTHETSPVTPAAPVAPDHDDPPGSIQPRVGWIAVGVGGVGLGVWAAAGLAALGRAGDLQCDSGRCPTAPDDVGSLNALRTASMVGFWAGLGSIAAGTTLLLTAPRARRPRPAALEPWIGIGAGGARAVF